MYSTYAPSFLEMDMAEHNSLEPADVKPFIHSPWFPLSSPPTESADVKPFSMSQTDDSSNSQAFSPDENSSFFQFFRGIYNDYQELTTRKQRLFKRQCLNFLHDLLDEEDGLTNYSDTGENPKLDIKIVDSVSINEDQKDSVFGKNDDMLST